MKDRRLPFFLKYLMTDFSVVPMNTMAAVGGKLFAKVQGWVSEGGRGGGAAAAGRRRT